MTYDEIMKWGQQQWVDVTDRIQAEGIGSAEFIQTGGMCAAIIVNREDGHYLLVTDADDTLSWDRDSHRGWYVGLYPPDNDGGSDPIAWRQHRRSDTDTLIQVIGNLLQMSPGSRNSQAPAEGFADLHTPARPS